MVPRNLQVSETFIQSRNLGTAFVMSLNSFCEFPQLSDFETVCNKVSNF